MDAVIDLPGREGSDTETGRRVRAFRATDHFALAAYQVARAFARPEGDELAREIRAAIARSGGALVAAASAEGENPTARGALETAHRVLLEIRYLLYLARRLGCIDLKRYRHLTTLHDAALRELASLLT